MAHWLQDSSFPWDAVWSNNRIPKASRPTIDDWWKQWPLDTHRWQQSPKRANIWLAIHKHWSLHFPCNFDSSEAVVKAGRVLWCLGCWHQDSSKIWWIFYCYCWGRRNLEAPRKKWSGMHAIFCSGCGRRKYEGVQGSCFFGLRGRLRGKSCFGLSCKRSYSLSSFQLLRWSIRGCVWIDVFR